MVIYPNNSIYKIFIVMRKKYHTEEERKEAIRIKNAKAYQKNREYHKVYREENSEKIADYQKTYYATTNPDIRLRKEFKIKNPDVIKNENRIKKNLYQKNKKSNDSTYKLKANIRTVISNLFKNRGYFKKDIQKY